MAIESLDDLLLHEMQDIYDAEHQLTEALPEMEKAASSSDLKKAFKSHLEQTKNHIQRLEEAFEMIDKKAKREKCVAMQGLVKEGSKMIEEDAEPAVKDAGLIAAAQRVEHYEMAGYGTLRTFAYLLGHQDVARIFQQTLDEEEMTDKQLTEIANKINVKAMS